MCGIAGIVAWPGLSPARHGELLDAVTALRHRGPDDCGTWFSPTAGLGHRRLSILDVSASGHQPMCSPDGRYVMVFNGEVYNFRALRPALEAAGHRFTSSGDSEVVLAALSTWGVDAAVRRFIGMFAIALWDNVTRTLSLVRDRLGVKPLYYGWDGHTLWFGSELKALRAFRHWQPEIDRAALAEYFRYGYINAPRSIYRGVSKLRPGHWLELRDEAQPFVHRYWSVLDGLDDPVSGSEDEAAEQLEALMADAFRLRMVSDVPVGMFLSGGIDSSIVTALLQKYHGDIKTFTIGFSEGAFDEAPHARRVAEHLGTTHTSRTLPVHDALRILPRWADLYDEPFADSSGLPTFLVSSVASEHVKVVLSADGGDELFGGYDIYANMLRNQARRRRVPAPVRSVVGGAMGILPIDALDERLASAPWLPAGWRGRRRPTWRLARIRDWLGNTSDGRMYDRALGNAWWGSQSPVLGANGASGREMPDSFPGSFGDQMCLWDLHHYLPGDILAKVDRATMAVSIEGREPLIDHRLVEFAFKLPPHLRRGSLGSKHLLRKVLHKYVPKALVERPKMGFGIPLETWLRGELRPLVEHHLDPRTIRGQGILDAAAVARARAAFDSRDNLVVNRIWSILAFQLWFERWG